MRNKFLTKILGATLGLAMAIGVGVGVANFRESQAKPVFATEYTKIATFDFSSSTPDGSTSDGLTNDTIKTLLNNSSSVANLVSSVTNKSGDVYSGKGSGGGSIPQHTLKIGKAGGGGAFTFAISGSDSVSKVVINGHVWKTTSSISVNGGTAQTYSTAQSATAHPFTFELASATKSITISVTTSAVCVASIDLYKTSAPAKTVTGLDVFDGELNELHDGDVVDLNANGAETVSADVACEVSYSAGASDGLVDITSAPSVAFDVSTDDDETYTLTFGANGDYVVTIATQLNDEVSIDVTYRVTGIVPVLYERVTSVAQLSVGSEIIIANTNGNYVLAPYTTGNRCPYVSSSLDAQGRMPKANIGSGFAIFTLGGSRGAWTLTDQNDMVYWGQSGQNYLKASESTTDTWNIEIDHTNHEAVITSKISGRWIGENSSDLQFTTYSNNGQDEVAIYMVNPPALSDIFSNNVTRSSLSYSYTKNAEDDFDYNNVTLRFGGIVTKLLWDELHAESEIQSYGVLLSTDEFLGANELKTKYNNVDDVNVRKYVNNYDPSSADPAASPSLFEDAEYNGVTDDYYVWNLRISLPKTDNKVVKADLLKVYVAVAFVVTNDDGVVFLNQTEKSAKTLAAGMISGPSDPAYNGSLAFLAALA